MRRVVGAGITALQGCSMPGWAGVGADGASPAMGASQGAVPARVPWLLGQHWGCHRAFK